MSASSPYLVVLLCTTALVTACSDERDGAPPYRLLPDNARVVADGKVIYDSECASCHGANLEGQPDWRVRDEDGYLRAPPHDASGHTWHHSDRQLFELTKHGLSKLAGGDYKSRMPKYDGVLSDEDIAAVLSFIKSQWPARLRKRHDQLNAASEK